MDTISYKTVSANKATVTKNWLIVDADNEVLGRFSSKVAKLLRGKHKTNFTPHVDCGDNVIILNAEKIRLTGKKLTDKEYITYTGYPGGQRFANPKDLLNSQPTKVVENAVHKMLPRNKLGNQMKRNLFIYAGTEHPHAGQQPKEFKIASLK